MAYTMNNYGLDKMRYYNSDKPPRFQKYYMIWRMLFALSKKKNHIDLFYKTQIGPGLYIGHPYGITINADSKIGSNVNIHKGVTIGQENRGKRVGAPTISNDVWIGINSTIVGKITIGDDVLIAPNSFVNCDVPSHSIVVGNPCIIRHNENATAGYIENRCQIY